MSDSEGWKTRSPFGMGLRLLLVFGLLAFAAVQVVNAFVTGSVDWPGRGHTELTWKEHPGWFIAAVIGWSIGSMVMARISLIGTKRVLWLVRR